MILFLASKLGLGCLGVGLLARRPWHPAWGPPFCGLGQLKRLGIRLGLGALASGLARPALAWRAPLPSGFGSAGLGYGLAGGPASAAGARARLGQCLQAQAWLPFFGTWVRRRSFGALSDAERWPSSIWRIRSAYSLMRASWVTIRMQRFSLRIFSFDEGDDRPAGVAVQGGGRLVEDQDLRAADDRARDRHALLLAARELHGQYLAPVLQADDLEVFSRLVDRLVPVALLQDQGNRHILGRGQPRETDGSPGRQSRPCSGGNRPAGHCSASRCRLP
jgi:hypothetical protein